MVTCRRMASGRQLLVAFSLINTGSAHSATPCVSRCYRKWVYAPLSQGYTVGNSICWHTTRARPSVGSCCTDKAYSHAFPRSLIWRSADKPSPTVPSPSRHPFFPFNLKWHCQLSAANCRVIEKWAFNCPPQGSGRTIWWRPCERASKLDLSHRWIISQTQANDTREGNTRSVINSNRQNICQARPRSLLKTQLTESQSLNLRILLCPFPL